MTTVADRQVRALRGRRRSAALRTIGELEDRGCEAAGYRLSGREVDHICCRHLYGDDRMLTVWPDEERTIVILVAPHDGTGSDVYSELLDALEVDMPQDVRDKPACCDAEGEPPTDPEAANAIADAVGRHSRTRRRAR